MSAPSKAYPGPGCKSCKFFAQGYCRNGAKCKLSHGELKKSNPERMQSAGGGTLPTLRRGRRARAPPAVSSSLTPSEALETHALSPPLPLQSSAARVGSPVNPPLFADTSSRVVLSDPGEDRTTSGSTLSSVKPQSKRGELPCFTWQRTRQCPKGDKCWYSHDSVAHEDYHRRQGGPVSTSTTRSDATASASMKSAGRGSDAVQPCLKPCHVWVRTGACGKGDNCRYLHDPAVMEHVRHQEETARQARLAEEEERARQTEAEERARQVRLAEEAERGRQARLAEEEAERCRVQEEVRLERACARQARREDGRRRKEAARQARLAEEAERARQAEAEERARQARLAEEAERARQARLAEEEAERRRVQEQIRLERERARQARSELEEAARRARDAEAEALFLERGRENAAKTIQHVILGSIVTLGAGLDVRNAITGFECCTFRIKGLPLDAHRDEVAALFTQQGVDAARFQIVSMKTIPQGTQEAVVVTAAELAELLLLGFDGLEFGDRTIDCEVGTYNAPGGMGVSAPQDANVLTISWRLPYESYVVEYLEYVEARRKMQKLHRTILNGRRMKVEMNTPPPGRVLPSFNRNSIKITNLPLTATRADVVRLSGSSNCRRLGGATQHWVDVLEAARRLLVEVEQACPTPQSIVSSDRSPADEIDGNAVLRVRFASEADAQVVHAALSARAFPFLKFAPRMHVPTTTFNLTIPVEQHRAQRKLWDSLIAGIPDRKVCSLVVRPEGKVVRVRLSGSSKPAVGALKVRVEGLSAGEVVPGWHRSLGYSKSTFWKMVLAQTGAYLRGDWKQQRLRVYGEPKAVEAAREMAKAELERLAAMEWSVFLKPQSVGFFVRQGIPALKELLGEDSVKFHAPSRRITVTGGEDARHQLGRLIDESLDSRRVATTAAAHEQQCPICFDDISSPFRLGCGHRYCITCIRHLVLSGLDSDDPQFPLACMGDEGRCAAPIALPTLEELLPANSFGRLLETAFTAYIIRRPAELKYCATPDCMQIYRAADAGVAKGAQCPSCFIRVCTGCGDEPHDGVSCDEQRRTKNWDADDAWMTEQDVKRCPACSVLMQKTEGCNHMECKCGAHFCWQCMGIFAATEIYNHMSNAHGGIYERAAAPVQNVDLREQQEVLRQAEERRAQAERVRQRQPDPLFIWPDGDLLEQGNQQRQVVQNWERQHQDDLRRREEENRDRIDRLRQQALERDRREAAERRRREEENDGWRERLRQQALERIQREAAERRRREQEAWRRREQEERRRRESGWGCVLM